jgi:spore germination protein YaaH
MLKKKLMLCVSVFISIFACVTVSAATFNDVPTEHWAYQQINAASSIGFMNGMGDGSFGIGQNVTRSQFVSMLVRMFGWQKISSAVTPSFQDNTDTSQWYYSDIETAVANGAIKTDSGRFRPEDNITREEMAVMLIRALGYDTLAAEAENMSSPFTDVTSNKGYITVAYDFGIVSGKAPNQFEPNGTALREEAAAMMMRCYDKSHSKLNFLHGFYAFSSYSQKDMAATMDAVSFGWSKMQYTPESGVILNTTSSNNNEWVVPSGYQDIVTYLKNNQVKTNLNIFLSASESSACNDILNSPENRKAAVNAIISELTISYKQLGYNPYSGVTLDFENIRGTELKANFVLFLNELKNELNTVNKTLYIVVQPPLKSGAYFDGYDFKAIGQVADKVILMAYDYQPSTIPQSVMDSGFTTTPVTPFDEIYYALKTITDTETGVQDRSKLVLGLSMSNVGWNTVDGKITNERGLVLSYNALLGFIQNNASVSYSEKYRNPYMTVQTDAGSTTIWYEDARSITDKIKLSEMFGINGASIWRIGLIPEYSADTNLNVYSSIKAMQ